MTVFTRKLTFKERWIRFIKHRYTVVLSYAGKGGTGKTLTADNIAIRAAKAGYKVGLCDLDLEMKSCARTMGFKGKRVERDRDKRVLHPVQHKDYPNLKMFSLSLMPFFSKNESSESIFWGGEYQREYMFQLVFDVDWGADLDILVFDCPAGISDSIIALSCMYKKIDFVILTGLNNETSTDGLAKALSTCKDNKIDVLGVVANQAYYICPHCKEKSYPLGKDAVRRLCKEQGAHYAGGVPLAPEINEGMDTGKPFVDSETYDNLWARIIEKKPKLRRSWLG